MTLTVVLNRGDQPGFDRYFNDVYDSHSKNYRQFLSQAEITQRFGPSRGAYAAVWSYLRKFGFQRITSSKNRMTLTVRGTRRQAERAFQVRIQDLQLAGGRIYANDVDPAVPIELAPHIQAIVGLLSPPKPMPAAEGQALPDPFGDLFQDIIDALNEGAGPEVTNIYQETVGQAAAPVFEEVKAAADIIITFEGLYDGAATAATSRKGLFRQNSASAGTGQKIGITATSSFLNSDVSDWLALAGLPTSLVNQVSQVPVAGGAAIGAGETDVLLGIDTILNLAPGAQIVVYEAPFASNAASFQAVLNAMINDGVTVISNTNIYCEDQTTLADVQSLDATLVTAAASGISVLSATGDTGSICSDGSAGTVGVPTDSPHVTAVGGSTGTIGAGNVYGTESWFDGSNDVPPLGPAGFGVSRYFQSPAYQSPLMVSPMRSVPDVVTLADPKFAPLLCEADAGGCPASEAFGGTSLATPIWAAYAALLNQHLQKPLGLLNPALYATAAASTFHSASRLGTDAAHVGLGSPNVTKLYLALSGTTVGPVSATTATVTASITPGQPLQTSVPADGTTAVALAVQLTDANGFPISGKSVTLSAAGNTVTISPPTAVTNSDNGAAVFEVTATTPGSATFTATDATDGVVLTQTASVTFVGPAATSGGINVAPAMVAADGLTAATITVTLKDANNQPAIGKTVTVMDGGAHAVITGPTPQVTDANGQIQFSATDQVNETVTFTAVDASDNNLTIPGSGTVTYSGSTNTACGVGLAPVPGTGYQITAFATGFSAAPTLYYNGVNEGCPGASTPTFTSTGAVLITDALTGGVYQLGLAGGTASPANLLNSLSPTIGRPIYGKDGSLYAAIGSEGAEIVQLDATSGAIVRVVASGLTCPAGLSVDPLSGDLFFDDSCTGGGTDDPSVYRIIDPANTNASQPTSVVLYATLPTTPSGGMAFAPNGTLYAISGYQVSGFASSQPATVQQISGTNSATVTVAPVSGLTSDFSLAIGMTNPDGSAQSLIVEPNGALTEVPIANPSAAVVLAAGTLSDEVTGPGGTVAGPDGCLYFSHYDTIYKLSESNGACQFSPTSPAPSINLTPTTVSPNPAQGGTQTFTATIHNISPLSGVAVNFLISGANTGVKLVRTDTNGNATLTYPGIFKGTDQVVATAAANASTNLASNIAKVTWSAGTDTSFLTLNLSPTEGTLNTQTTLIGSLSDISVSPPAAATGQVVTLALGTESCNGTTDSQGNVSCSVKVSQAGAQTLTATFAGSASLSASTATAAFKVAGPQAQAPSVTIALSPTTIAAGSPATLTWSSTNATSCAASGAWNGTQPTSGSTTVTPTASGSYTYTLTCSGAGGTRAASAVLAATLVQVTVIATSGGGTMGGWFLVVLVVLLALRYVALVRRDGRVLSSLVLLVCLAIASPDSRSAKASVDGAPENLSPPGTSQTYVTDQADSSTWLDSFYLGGRAGYMPLRINGPTLDRELASLGFDGLTANTEGQGAAGTLFLGYAFNPLAGLELGYTYRNAETARITGTIPSAASLTPLLQDTTELLRGYGNIASLSYTARLEVLPRFSLEPRLGGFFWATKVTAVAMDDRVDKTKEGGGVTTGITAAYRIWRGLEFGINVDHFHGFPHNIATIYGGSLEWRFGSP